MPGNQSVSSTCYDPVRWCGNYLLVDDNEFYLMSDLHTEADLGEGCVPVGQQLGLVVVKQSLPSWKFEVKIVAQEFGIEVESWLSGKKVKKACIRT